jgi:hypothetical protein
MFTHFAQDPGMEYLLLDSTVVCAHPCAAGAPQKTAGRLSKRLDEAEVDSAPKSM